MRKFLIACCLILCASAAANAQWFIGGSVSFTENSSRSETTYRSGNYYESREVEINPVTTTFGISPRIGYMFNDRWLAGLDVGYTFQKESSSELSDYTTKSNAVFIRPFTRCNLLWFGPFMLGLEASGTYSFAKIEDDQEWKRQDRTRRMYGGQIAPILELDVSKNLSLECRLNFLSIGYFHTREIEILEDDNFTYRDKSTSNAATGIFSGDEIFRLGDLTFGVIYKF